MNIAIVIPLAIIVMATLGLTFSDANAELGTNNAFILEGSGFAVTEESIKISEIDFAISTGTQQGSTIRMLIEFPLLLFVLCMCCCIVVFCIFKCYLLVVVGGGVC